MPRNYTATERFMMGGFVTGLLLGFLAYIATGNVVWMIFVALLGLIVGISLGQLRDR